MIWLLTTLQQGLLFLATMILIGCVTWHTLIGRKALATLKDYAEEFDAAASLVVRWARLSSGALIAAWIMRMTAQILAFRDPFAPLWDDISLLLFQTVWGTIWMVQGAVILLIAVVLTWGVSREDGSRFSRSMGMTSTWSMLVFLVLALILTLAMSGHAMGTGAWRWASVTADALHTLAAGAWLGSLAVILGVSRRAFGGAERAPPAFSAQINRFSPIALASGGTVVTMGIVLSWTHLTSISDLWTTNYGLILSSKIFVVILILGLGFWNWRRGVPTSDQVAGMRTIQRRGSWEVGLAAGVILLTAILVHSAKP